MATDSPSGMVWALTDRVGSVDTLTDENGVVVNQRNFNSFGRVLSETNPSVSFRYGYTGRELDLESGLNYYRARYYDPQVGRFISVDPMGFGAGDTNLYRYVGNNSTNATDPTGMWLNFAIGAGIGFALDLGFQLWENQGDFSKIDPTRLAISTISGAIGGGIGSGLVKGGALVAGTALADVGLSLGARTAINAGVGFNLGYWGKVAENGIKGQDLTEGALFTGIAGGAGAAAGELLQAGAGAIWKSQGVQSALAKATSVAENTSIFARNRATDARIILDPKIRFSDRLNDADNAILENVRTEARSLLGIDAQTNKEVRKYSGKISRGDKAIIDAAVNIEGVQEKQLRAFSGEGNFSPNFIASNELAKRYAPYIPNSKAYVPTINSSSKRVADTELKIFNEIIRLTKNNPNAVGTVRFTGNLETCYSCQKLALDLREIRPNIKLDFVYTPRETGSKLFYNKIRNWGSGLTWSDK